MKRIVLVLAFLVPCLVQALPGKAGPYSFDLVTNPAVIPVGKANLKLHLSGPTDGVQVKAMVQMPGMNMGEIEQAGIPLGSGDYRIPAAFAMAGAYDAKVTITGPAGTGLTTLVLHTGQSLEQGASASIPFLPILGGVGLVVGLGIGIRKKVLTASVLTTLIGFVVVLVGAVYAVNHFRRPGAMTPIEAQVMDMAASPPEGSTPVHLATAAVKPFASTVRYSGQVVGFVEQEVVARTQGVITSMPVYVGNVVHRGELLASLDVSQLAPQVAEKRAMVDSAQQGVRVAEADLRQSMAMIHQAESEYGQYHGAVEEAEANLSAAESERRAAQAELTVTESEIRDAQAKVAAAQADANYWKSELERMEKLFAAQAVSRDELQKERAEAQKADAMLRQAREAVTGTQAKRRAAEAGVQKADAMVTAAQKKLNSAKSELIVHHAHVQIAEATSSSAKEKVAQSVSGVRQAQASLSGSLAGESYSQLRAMTDGVVTQRLISPGTLVNPGQSVLRVAQVSPIRLQANVPEADLALIQVGMSVRAWHRDRPESPLVAKVTSVAPSVDPQSRTGLVEAVIENRDRRFMPGQFVNLEIELGSPEPQLVIPTEAIQRFADQPFVWVAVKGATVTKRIVKVGQSSQSLTPVLEGLKAGEQVVTQGGEGLIEGQSVSATQVPLATQEIHVTASGFVPSSITLTASDQRELTFIRDTDETCAKEIQFDALGIKKALPLHQPVTVQLPESAKGEVRFACAMNMFAGKVILP